MNRIAARHIAKTLAVAAALIASAAIASASAKPAMQDPVAGRIAVMTVGPTAMETLAPPAYLLDQPLLASNTISVKPVPQDWLWTESAATVAPTSDRAFVDEPAPPKRWASLLATAALVAFFFLRRLV